MELSPGDQVEFGTHPAREVFKVKMQHVTLRNEELSGLAYKSLIVGKRAEAMPEMGSNTVTGGAAALVDAVKSAVAAAGKGGQQGSLASSRA